MRHWRQASRKLSRIITVSRTKIFIEKLHGKNIMLVEMWLESRQISLKILLYQEYLTL